MKKAEGNELDRKLNMLFDTDNCVKINISGTSMLPLLNDGDEITVRKINAQDVRRGDILLFKINSTLVVHRFIGFKELKNGETKILQCGDNSMEFNTVEKDSILGKVTKIKTTFDSFNINSRFWLFLHLIIGWMEYLTYLLTFQSAETDDKIFLRLYNKIVYKIMRTVVHFLCMGKSDYIKE